MEISRHFKPAVSVQSESPALNQAKRNSAAEAASSAAASRATSRSNAGLEALQEAMRSLPDVDLDKVTALKAALQRGELSTDSAVLANSIISYHQGSDA